MARVRTKRLIVDELQADLRRSWPSEAEAVRLAAERLPAPDWQSTAEVVEPFGDERDREAERWALDDVSESPKIDAQLGSAAEFSVWSPIPDIVTGNWRAPRPGLVSRSDGQRLLYPGEIHWLSGEPGAGKGWIASFFAKQVMEAGGIVAYLDYESTADAIVERMRLLGLADETISRYLWHASWGTFDDLEPRMIEDGWPSLVVVDAVAGAMALQDLDPDNNSATERFVQSLLRPLALGLHWSDDTKPGAAVLAIDHVTKATDSRGRWAIGAQRKLGATSVAYLAKAVRPIEPGRTDGLVQVSLAKDRNGHIQAASVGTKMPKLVGGFHVDAACADGLIRCEFRPAEEPVSGPSRAAAVEEHVRAFLAEVPGATKRELRDAVKGSKDAIDSAVANLSERGEVLIEQGPNNAKLHYRIEPAEGKR